MVLPLLEVPVCCSLDRVVEYVRHLLAVLDLVWAARSFLIVAYGLLPQTSKDSIFSGQRPDSEPELVALFLWIVFIEVQVEK